MIFWNRVTKLVRLATSMDLQEEKERTFVSSWKLINSMAKTIN